MTNLPDKPNVDDLRKTVLFWLDKMMEVTYKQSDKDAHGITAGVTADQILWSLYQRLASEAVRLYKMKGGKTYATYQGSSNIYYNEIKGIPLSKLAELFGIEEK